MEIITTKELSQILKVKEKTLYQWAELRQIPHIKLNGSIRFNLADIVSWIKSCTREATSEYNPVAKLEVRKGGKKV